MEPEEDIHISDSATADPPPRGPRPVCSNCTRPGPVCLCHSLPAQPIKTQTQIIILHHPHEANHKLSTTPILTKCLSNSTAIVARKLKPGLSPLLDQSPPAIYLFPQPKPHPPSVYQTSPAHPSPNTPLRCSSPSTPRGSMPGRWSKPARGFCRRLRAGFVWMWMRV
ncbi:DTW domain-containing protein 2 [Prunus yedoensis var. nudiflora]|uniref:tRNA-uridine aminocarboxypropyltransferase n=1 Tax=Prunus yedoensis var. nudiflora TaxID=2094558 RepID=A0A314Z0P8_PRUYE|nr:DTW domain-containing protein 2 [Prunus yedoensis var. nudiflora]